MKPTTDTLLRHLEARLESMCADGALLRWGSGEALEYQAIQLLEMRNVIRRPVQSQKNKSEVRRAYRGFIYREFGGASTFLWAILKEEDTSDMLPTILRRFVATLDEELPQESVFDTSKVALEIQFPQDYKEPLLGAVCAYVVRLQKSMATLIHARPAYRGYDLHFPMPDISIDPPNGVGPSVKMALDAPTPRQTGLNDALMPPDAFADTVRATINTISMVSEGERPNAGRIYASFANRAEANRMIKHASDIVPGGDIQAVIFGGTSIGEPAAVNANCAHRFAMLLDSEKLSVDFAHEGSVDVLDFSQGWFRLMTRQGNREMTFRCWAVMNQQFMNNAKLAAPNGRLLVRGVARMPRPLADGGRHAGRPPIINVEALDVVLLRPSVAE